VRSAVHPPGRVSPVVVGDGSGADLLSFVGVTTRAPARPRGVIRVVESAW
jgi:hypothetical protein